MVLGLNYISNSVEAYCTGQLADMPAHELAD